MPEFLNHSVKAAVLRGNIHLELLLDLEIPFWVFFFVQQLVYSN